MSVSESEGFNRCDVTIQASLNNKIYINVASTFRCMFSKKNSMTKEKKKKH